VRTTFGDSYGGLRLIYSQELSPLGTAGALRLALPLFESDPILVMNGDSVCQADLGVFWNWHQTKDANATLLLSQVLDVQRYGRVQVSEEGLVLCFDEKGSKSRPGWINAGIYIITRSLIEMIPVGCAVSLERDMFPSWVGRGLYGYQSQGRFLDIGTPESYAQADALFALDRR